MALPKVGQGPKTGEYGVDAFRTTTKRRDRKSTRLNSSPQSNLVCRLLLEKKKLAEFIRVLMVDSNLCTPLLSMRIYSLGLALRYLSSLLCSVQGSVAATFARCSRTLELA